MLRSKSGVARKHRAAHKNERPQSFYALLKCVFLALPATATLGALLLLAATAILLTTKDPDRYHVIVGTVLLYVTAALGGMLATLFYGRRSPVLCGIFEGVCLILLLTVPSLLFRGGTANAALSFLYRLMLLPASLVGALLGARRPRQRKHRF